MYRRYLVFLYAEPYPTEGRFIRAIKEPKTDNDWDALPPGFIRCSSILARDKKEASAKFLELITKEG